MHTGMQQTLKAKVTNLLEEKLEAQDASDESNDMNESEHSEELFDFLLKTSINTRVLKPEQSIFAEAGAHI